MVFEVELLRGLRIMESVGGLGRCLGRCLRLIIGIKL